MCPHREKEKAESEEKLQREMERLRQQARKELDHTRSYTKELYERENRWGARVILCVENCLCSGF